MREHNIYKGHQTHWDNDLKELAKRLTPESVHLFLDNGLVIEHRENDKLHNPCRVSRLRDFNDLLYGSHKTVHAYLSDSVSLIVKADNGGEIIYQC